MIHSYEWRWKFEKCFYDYFKFFLLNLISNLMNRRFIVYENWERIRQRSNQKMSNFKNELKKYEFHLSSFEKIHKINFFFDKLLSFLKKKVLNIEKMSTIKKNLFAKIILLKKILKRERRTNDNSFNNSNFNNKKENKNKNKIQQQFQQQQQSQQQKQNQFNQNIFNDNERNTRAKNKQKRQKKKNIFKMQCYDCDKMNYYKNNCVFKSKWSIYEIFIVVVEINVKLKNNQISYTFRKRNKKNQ